MQVEVTAIIRLQVSDHEQALGAVPTPVARVTTRGVPRYYCAVTTAFHK
jgi:hypothetical protein